MLNFQLGRGMEPNLGDKIMNLYKSRGLHGQEMSAE